MIDALDITSITVVGMIAGLSVATAMILNWLVQKQQPGVSFWAMAYVFSSTGFILIGLRPHIPGFWSVVFANALLTGSWCFIWVGLRRFIGRTVDGWLAAGLLLATHAGGVAYFLYIAPDVAARIVLYSVINSILVGLCILELLRHARHVSERTIYYALAGILACRFVFNVIRLVHTLINAPVENLLTAGAIHKLSFIEGIVDSVMLACCLIIASSLRLRVKLEESQTKLEELASTDDLSGLCNRRRFMELATREIDRSRRYGRPLSLIMLDVDHFKSVNDNHGHQCGDDVIKSIGDMLRRELRDQDISSRIGGEEFAILLPEASSDAAAEVAERLRMVQASQQTHCGDGSVVSCTASFGITELTDGDVTIYDMLPRADQALYAAKLSGRNRVMMASRPDISDMIIAIN